MESKLSSVAPYKRLNVRLVQKYKSFCGAEIRFWEVLTHQRHCRLPCVKCALLLDKLKPMSSVWKVVQIMISCRKYLLRYRKASGPHLDSSRVEAALLCVLSPLTLPPARQSGSIIMLFKLKSGSDTKQHSPLSNYPLFAVTCTCSCYPADEPECLKSCVPRDALLHQDNLLSCCVNTRLWPSF